MTLKALTLINFQKHIELKIELDPFCTTFVGESDQGKSSIIRALFWLTINYPAGSAFITHGETFCKVKLEIDDHLIVRGRGVEDNYYTLDKERLYAFGKSVPEDIEKVLNIDEINFQLQHDPPFWFALTSGEVSKELNKIVNLVQIDKTLHTISKGVKKSKQQTLLCKERVRKAKERRKELRWVIIAENELKLVEEKAILVSENRSRIVQLSSLIQDGQSLALIHFQAVEAGSALSLLLKRGEHLLSLRGRIKNLRNLDQQYQEYSEILKRAIPKSKITVLVDGANRLQRLLWKKERLESLIKQVKNLEEEIKQNEKSTMQLKKELENLIGKKCPLCLQKIPAPSP